MDFDLIVAAMVVLSPFIAIVVGYFMERREDAEDRKIFGDW